MSTFVDFKRLVEYIDKLFKISVEYAERVWQTISEQITTKGKVIVHLVTHPDSDLMASDFAEALDMPLRTVANILSRLDDDEKSLLRILITKQEDGKRVPYAYNVEQVNQRTSRQELDLLAKKNEGLGEISEGLGNNADDQQPTITTSTVTESPTPCPVATEHHQPTQPTIAPSDPTPDTPQLSTTARAIVNYLHRDGTLTYDELASLLNISTTMIHRHIRRLKSLGIIEHIGPRHGGRWRTKERML